MKRMSLREHLSRVAAILVCLAVFLSTGVTTAFAYERINTGAEASLTATFAESGTGIEGVSFRLYRVADVSDTVEFTLTGGFTDAPVSLNAIESASQWADMAVTLSAYAGANGVSADAAGTTNANGRVTFPGLTVGLYLLVGDTTVVEDHSYAPTPAIIMLPTLLDNDTWEYTPTVDVKYTKTFVAQEQDITVKKVWSDGNRAGRPNSVKVQLLRDGEVQETVTLNKDNNWTYTWSDLAGTYEDSDGKTKAYTWTVNEERVPTGYTVSVSQNGNTFTVTNTYKTTPPPDDSKLPQTGTLNWPIPVLTVSGLLLVVLGWCLVSRKRES